jgi:hypothetical protein
MRLRRSRVGGRSGSRVLAGWVVLALLTAKASAASLAGSGLPADMTPPEAAVRGVVADYERAIETKDLSLFRSVKPNLTGDEERRLRKAFESTRTHEVVITIDSIQIQGETAVVHLSRRDTLDGSIVSSFPQTLRLQHGPHGWAIEEIGK